MSTRATGTPAGVPTGSGQVISKKRVIDHGEVLTADREVNAMLDLVKQETERIDSRFLVPACGTGQFPVEILNRKLDVVAARYRKNLHDYQRYLVVAVSSVYGIELLEDNVLICRSRLIGLAESRYRATFKEPMTSELVRTIRFIVERNIIWGDALTLRTVADPDKWIELSEWSLVRGSKVKRRDFVYDRMLHPRGYLDAPLTSDTGGVSYIPKPIKEWPAVHFLSLPDAHLQPDI